jgi:hypothetical protein
METNVPASASHKREASDQTYYKLTPNKTTQVTEGYIHIQSKSEPYQSSNKDI